MFFQGPVVAKGSGSNWRWNDGCSQIGRKERRLALLRAFLATASHHVKWEEVKRLYDLRLQGDDQGNVLHRLDLRATKDTDPGRGGSTRKYASARGLSPFTSSSPSDNLRRTDGHGKGSDVAARQPHRGPLTSPRWRLRPRQGRSNDFLSCTWKPFSYLVVRGTLAFRYGRRGGLLCSLE